MAVVDSSRPEHHMSNSAAAVQVERRGRAPGRGGPAGALVLGDYVGQSAAHAAQAVRRAGLRPGLDRSFGCDPDLTGTVVAQDPPAGSDLARNAMVTLYVAAPGPTPAQETAESDIQSDDQSVAPLGAADAVPPKDVAPQAHSGTRRPRKPRLAAATTRTLDPPPEPITTPHQILDGPIAPGWGLRAGDEELSSPALEEAAFDDTHPKRPHDELAVHPEEIFAARTGEIPPWRRVYPRRPIATVLRRPLAWVMSHPVLATTAGAMLAVWIAVAVAGGLGAHPGHTPGAAVISQREPGIRVEQAPGERTPVRARRRPSRSDGSTKDRTRRRRARRSRRSASRGARVAAEAAGASTPSLTSSPRPAAAGRTPAPGSEPTRGGVFSP